VVAAASSSALALSLASRRHKLVWATECLTTIAAPTIAPASLRRRVHRHSATLSSAQASAAC
jgi:hypothetical protein